MTNHLETGVFRFHHDIQKNDGDVVVRLQDRQCLGGGKRTDELERTAGKFETLQGEFRYLMDGEIVIDDQHLPPFSPKRSVWRGAYRRTEEDSRNLRS